MLRLLRASLVAGLLAGLTACSGGTPAPAVDAPVVADTLEAAEAREAAIVRGDAVPGQAPAGDAGAATCAKAQGTWSAPKQVCGMTESLCVATGASNWEAGTGCVVQVGSQTECTGFSGLAWTQGRCVLAHLTGQELADNGF